MKLPKKLEKKRDELAKDSGWSYTPGEAHGAMIEGFIKGFNAGAQAVLYSDTFVSMSDALLGHMSRQDALSKLKNFLGED